MDDIIEEVGNSLLPILCFGGIWIVFPAAIFSLQYLLHDAKKQIDTLSSSSVRGNI